MNTESTAGRPLPRTIPDYLEQLRQALAGADKALVQDALYDAEEYLRSELAANPGRAEAEVITDVAGSYGAPEEVADIYRETEITVAKALRAPRPPQRRSLAGRFFGVVADPYTYGSLFYMLLSLATGVFYFTWVVTGASTSGGLMILIVGVPLLLLFLLSVRLLSLVEGRIVEALLGVRMPRRPLYTQRNKSWLARIGELFTDARTWTTIAYLVLMLPLGVAYFTTTVTLLATSLGLVAAPFAVLFGAEAHVLHVNGVSLLQDSAWWALPLLAVGGALLLFVTLHLARAVGRFHGWLAKHLLVRDPVI